jgi:multidrug efflux pump subunit AcrA (membrane-fusion protein)
MSGERVERRAITVGTDAEGDDVVVLAGISPGEVVVVEAPADLADGEEVEVRER